ncbi:MAG TPA: LPS assembly protein LptD [Methylomirabilota bacterium]|nr:LPS assembly protein LptD [Methylomirabilota bacterium]
MTRSRALVVLLACALLASPAPAAAQAPATATVPTPGGDVTILADRLEQVGGENLLVATGNVEIVHGTARLLADRVEINRETGDATAQGRVLFYDGEDRLAGERIEYNVKTGVGVVYRGRMQAAPYYRIGGERIERLGESVYRVHRGVFTTCEDEASPAWSFRFDDATADLEEWIYGTGASFRVKDVPLIPYLPFFAAAIRRERQTGFLAPKLGTSSRKGFFVEAPFFWAISDSMDATFALDYYSSRGVGGSAEYRYVLSQQARGSVSGFYVNEVFQHGDGRGYGRFEHDWSLGPTSLFRVDLNGVSDDGVLRTYEDTSSRRLAQRADSNVFYTRSWPGWNFVGRAYAYQDLTTNHPVELQRLPELTVQGVRQPIPALPGFLYEVSTGATHFVRELGSEGTRLDLHPRVSRPIALAGYATLTPFAGGRLTYYDRTVTDTGVVDGVFIEHTAARDRVRELGEVGADAETRATRVYQTGGALGLQSLLHSIEPRTHYIRIVGNNFYSLPIWTDRVDRVPEASWLEYSVMNRLRGRTVAAEGGDVSRLDLARVRVAHAVDILNDRWGNLAGDLLVQPTPRLAFRSDVSYSVVHGIFQAFTTDLAMTMPYLTANVGTRYDRRQAFVPEFVEIPGTWNPGGDVPDRASVNFVQAALSGELTRNLIARASTNWDVRTDTFVESRFGIDFKFQCWALLVEYIRRGDEAAGRAGDNEFRFSLNLLGMGGAVGTRLGASESGGVRLK